MEAVMEQINREGLSRFDHYKKLQRKYSSFNSKYPLHMVFCGRTSLLKEKKFNEQLMRFYFH